MLITLDTETITRTHEYRFDENNRNWAEAPEYNTLFIKHQVNYFNNKLRAQGFVFLNDVLEALGYEPTSIGAITGWWGGDMINVDAISSNTNSGRIQIFIETDGLIFHKI